MPALPDSFAPRAVTVWGPSGRRGPSGCQGRQDPDNLAKPGFPQQQPSPLLRAAIPRPGSPGMGFHPRGLPLVPSGPQSPGLAGEQVPAPACLCTWKRGGISRLPSCLSPASLLPLSLLRTGPPRARRRPGGTQPSGRTWPAPSSSFQWAPAGPRNTTSTLLTWIWTQKTPVSRKYNDLSKPIIYIHFNSLGIENLPIVPTEWSKI